MFDILLYLFAVIGISTVINALRKDWKGAKQLGDQEFPLTRTNVRLVDLPPELHPTIDRIRAISVSCKWHSEHLEARFFELCKLCDEYPDYETHLRHMCVQVAYNGASPEDLITELIEEGKLEQ